MQLSNDWNEWKILVQEFLSSKILQDLTYVHWPQDEQDVLLSTNDIRSDRNLMKKKGRSWCFMIGKILEGGKERREEGMVNSSPSLWCVVASFSRGRGRGRALLTRRDGCSSARISTGVFNVKITRCNSRCCLLYHDLPPFELTRSLDRGNRVHPTVPSLSFPKNSTPELVRIRCNVILIIPFFSFFGNEKKRES